MDGGFVPHLAVPRRRSDRCERRLDHINKCPLPGGQAGGLNVGFWVEVARRWRSALGHNRAVVKQHDFRECQKGLRQSLPSGVGSPGIGAPRPVAGFHRQRLYSRLMPFLRFLEALRFPRIWAALMPLDPGSGIAICRDLYATVDFGL